MYGLCLFPDEDVDAILQYNNRVVGHVLFTYMFLTSAFLPATACVYFLASEPPL